jgi:hypothetical protein
MHEGTVAKIFTANEDCLKNMLAKRQRKVCSLRLGNPTCPAIGLGDRFVSIIFIFLITVFKQLWRHFLGGAHTC